MGRMAEQYTAKRCQFVCSRVFFSYTISFMQVARLFNSVSRDLGQRCLWLAIFFGHSPFKRWCRVATGEKESGLEGLTGRATSSIDYEEERGCGSRGGGGVCV